MGDDARRAILARRARFVAAALASAGLTAACAKQQAAEPRQCLSMPQPNPDSGAPQPCLEPMPSESDAGPPPTPCLEPPPPQVCLSQPIPTADSPPGDFAKPPPGK